MCIYSLLYMHTHTSSVRLIGLNKRVGCQKNHHTFLVWQMIANANPRYFLKHKLKEETFSGMHNNHSKNQNTKHEADSRG
jgi:hypothetical protein